MISNIQEKFDSMASKYNALLQNLDALSPDKLYFKAGPDRWSIVEVIEHLVLTEDDIVKQISTQGSSFDSEKRSPDKFKTVVKVMERDIEVDVPDEILEPHGQLTLEEHLSRWDRLREKLHTFLTGIDSENMENLVYRHPFAGPLDISETLHFIEVHFDNHMRHIERILDQMA